MVRQEKLIAVQGKLHLIINTSACKVLSPFYAKFKLSALCGPKVVIVDRAKQSQTNRGGEPQLDPAPGTEPKTTTTTTTTPTT